MKLYFPAPLRRKRFPQQLGYEALLPPSECFPGINRDCHKRTFSALHLGETTGIFDFPVVWLAGAVLDHKKAALKIGAGYFGLKRARPKIAHRFSILERREIFLPDRFWDSLRQECIVAEGFLKAETPARETYGWFGFRKSPRGFQKPVVEFQNERWNFPAAVLETQKGRFCGVHGCCGATRAGVSVEGVPLDPKKTAEKIAAAFLSFKECPGTRRPTFSGSEKWPSNRGSGALENEKEEGRIMNRTAGLRQSSFFVVPCFP